MKLKKYSVLVAQVFAVLLVVSLSACSGGSANQGKSDSPQATSQEVVKKPLDLTGSWKTDTFKAEIKNDVITIWIVNEEKESKSLYWVGSVPATDTTDNKYDFTSEGNVEEMQKSILSSRSKTKDFKYKDDVLSFEFTALGTTKTVKMRKE